LQLIYHDLNLTSAETSSESNSYLRIIFLKPCTVKNCYARKVGIYFAWHTVFSRWIESPRSKLRGISDC